MPLAVAWNRPALFARYTMVPGKMVAAFCAQAIWKSSTHSNVTWRCTTSPSASSGSVPFLTSTQWCFMLSRCWWRWCLASLRAKLSFASKLFQKFPQLFISMFVAVAKARVTVSMNQFSSLCVHSLLANLQILGAISARLTVALVTGPSAVVPTRSLSACALRMKQWRTSRCAAARPSSGRTVCVSVTEEIWHASIPRLGK